MGTGFNLFSSTTLIFQNLIQSLLVTIVISILSKKSSTAFAVAILFTLKEVVETFVEVGTASFSDIVAGVVGAYLGYCVMQRTKTRTKTGM